MSIKRSCITGMSLVFSTMLLAGSAAAQDSTPAATPGGPPEGYPVAIHQGTCDDPTSEPAFEIGNAVTPGVTEEGNDVTTVGESDQVLVLTEASSTIEVTLGDLGEENHVVAVHQSPDDYDTIIACGQISGVVDEGKLVVALAPVGGSPVVGVAIFNEDTSGVLGLGEDQVQVTAYVFDTSTDE